MPSATAAAEPDEDPPGVCAGLSGTQGCVADREVASSPAPSQRPREGESTRLGVGELAAWHLLSSVRGLGPQAAAAIHTAGLTPAQLIENPDLYPLKGKRAEGVVTAIGALTDKERTLIRPFVSGNCKFPIYVNRKLHTWKFVGGSDLTP